MVRSIWKRLFFFHRNSWNLNCTSRIIFNIKRTSRKIKASIIWEWQKKASRYKNYTFRQNCQQLLTRHYIISILRSHPTNAYIYFFPPTSAPVSLYKELLSISSDKKEIARKSVKSLCFESARRFCTVQQRRKLNPRRLVNSPCSTNPCGSR